MKRISLWILIVAALGLLISGCAIVGSDDQGATSSSATPKQEQKQDTKKIDTAVPKGIPVLMYHKIGPDKDNDAVIREDLFREQMQFLKDNGFNPITMEQLYGYITDGKPVPVKPVVLTFDDGYADTYSIVFPIMKEYGFAATVFVNPGDVGTRMTWAQLKEMKEGGMTISNHGFNHVEMSGLTQSEQVENIKKAQEALSRELGIEGTPWFCFPWGEMNEFSEAAAKEAGVKMAFRMDSGWTHAGENPYRLHRVWIGNAVDIKHFEERLTTQHFSDL